MQQAFPAHHPDVFAHPAGAAIPGIHSQPSTIHRRTQRPAKLRTPSNRPATGCVPILVPPSHHLIESCHLPQNSGAWTKVSFQQFHSGTGEAVPPP